MGEFRPVSTKADLDTLDEAEIIQGYRDGLADDPEPGSNRSRSYWHGWRNGMADKGRIPMDCHMRNLAREVVRNRRSH